MRSELDFFGVLVPGLLVCGVIAMALNAVLRRLLAYTGVYRIVWHRTLFDLALFILMLGLVVWLSAAAGWQ